MTENQETGGLHVKQTTALLPACRVSSIPLKCHVAWGCHRMSHWQSPSPPASCFGDAKCESHVEQEFQWGWQIPKGSQKSRQSNPHRCHVYSKSLRTRHAPKCARVTLHWKQDSECGKNIRQIRLMSHLSSNWFLLQAHVLSRMK